MLSNIIAFNYLWLDSMERKGEPRAFAKPLPSLEVLDQPSYRIVAFVFPLWTLAVIADANWAETAWGCYFGLHPRETCALIT